MAKSIPPPSVVEEGNARKVRAEYREAISLVAIPRNHELVVGELLPMSKNEASSGSALADRSHRMGGATKSAGHS